MSSSGYPYGNLPEASPSQKIIREALMKHDTLEDETTKARLRLQEIQRAKANWESSRSSRIPVVTSRLKEIKESLSSQESSAYQSIKERSSEVTIPATSAPSRSVSASSLLKRYSSYMSSKTESNGDESVNSSALSRGDMGSVNSIYSQQSQPTRQVPRPVTHTIEVRSQETYRVSDVQNNVNRIAVSNSPPQRTNTVQNNRIVSPDNGNDSVFVSPLVNKVPQFHSNTINNYNNISIAPQPTIDEANKTQQILANVRNNINRNFQVRTESNKNRYEQSHNSSIQSDITDHDVPVQTKVDTSHFENEIKGLRRQVEDLELVCKAHDDRANAISMEKTQLENQLKDKTDEIMSIQNQLSLLRNQLQSKSAKLSEAEMNLSHVQQEHEGMKQALDEVRGENNNLRVHFENTRKQAIEISAKCHELETENAKHIQSFQELQKRFSHESEKWANEREKFNQSLSDYDTSLSSTNAKNAELVNYQTRFQDELNKSYEAIDEAQSVARKYRSMSQSLMIIGSDYASAILKSKILFKFKINALESKFARLAESEPNAAPVDVKTGYYNIIGNSLTYSPAAAMDLGRMSRKHRVVNLMALAFLQVIILALLAIVFHLYFNDQGTCKPAYQVS